MKATFALFIIAVFIVSCNHKKTDSAGMHITGTYIDSLPGSSPHFTKDAAGNIVLSWVRSINDSSFVFCYAVSPDGGNTFNAPVVIPASKNIKPHAENLPKVIFKPSGEIIAIWGAASVSTKNKYAGSIFYAQSFDEGSTWTDAQPMVKDTAGYDQRYFDVALLPNGEAGIIWLDNRKQTTKDGSALYYAVTNDKSGFSREKRITDPTCQCCRTDLFVDNKKNVHVVYRNIIQDSIRDMVHQVSIDGGNTFSAPKRISNDNWVLNACPHTGPAMTENEKGLHFAWFTGGEKEGTFYTNSASNGSNFAPAVAVTKKGSHPQMTAAPDGTITILWDEKVKKGNKTFSRIGVQTRTPDGNTLQERFLTPDTANATYPVIIFSKEKKAMVAYSQKKNGKNFIAYQSIYQP